MKKTNVRFSLPLLALVLHATTSMAAGANLVVNGDFSAPNLSSLHKDWGMFANGQVQGWTNTLNNDGIEIDNTVRALGGYSFVDAANHVYTQNAELNGNTYDSISQTIHGLIVGDSYNLSWAYGDRYLSGFAETQVFLGGNLVATDEDTHYRSGAFRWEFNSINLIATSATETLTFKAVDTSHLGGWRPSYGNEITAVSLTLNPTTQSTVISHHTTASVPEPSNIVLMLVGLIFISMNKLPQLQTRKAKI